MVKVSPIGKDAEPTRLGFLLGQFAVPEDFDRMGEAETETLFSSQL